MSKLIFSCWVVLLLVLISLSIKVKSLERRMDKLEARITFIEGRLAGRSGSTNAATDFYWEPGVPTNNLFIPFTNMPTVRFRFMGELFSTNGLPDYRKADHKTDPRDTLL